jgi:hypothetical protein
VRRAGWEVACFKPRIGGNVVKCDVCDQEFANSEEVKRHKEQVHPMGEEDGEKPDLMETPEEMPEPAEQRNR